jgi:acyl-CoA thioesterase
MSEAALQPAGLHPFDAALVLSAGSQAHTYEIPTSQSYWNMVGPFGGWLVAAGIKAIQREASADSVPIEAHARFYAAPKEGTLSILVSCQQQGRSVGFWRAQISQVQNGAARVCCEVSAIIAPERDSLEVRVGRIPAAAAPDTIRPVRLREAPVRWIQHYDFRYIHGLPFVGEQSEHVEQLRTRLWVREAEERSLDWLNLAAICDVVIPRVFLLQKGPSPIATVSLSIYFHATRAEIAASGNAWLLLDIESHGVRRGFFDHSVTVWREDGLALASSTQVDWFN